MGEPSGPLNLLRERTGRQANSSDSPPNLDHPRLRDRRSRCTSSISESRFRTARPHKARACDSASVGGCPVECSAATAWLTLLRNLFTAVRVWNNSRCSRANVSRSCAAMLDTVMPRATVNTASAAKPLTDMPTDAGGDFLDPVQLRFPFRVSGLLPRPGPLEGHLVLPQQLPKPFPADAHHPDRVGGQVVDELADTPADEGPPQFLRAGQGGRDDVGRLVRTDTAGTASRPLRVQAGQPDLIEPMHNLTDRVLIGLYQRRDRRHRRSARRRHHDQRAADPDRTCFPRRTICCSCCPSTSDSGLHSWGCSSTGRAPAYLRRGPGPFWHRPSSRPTAHRRRSG
jgi:hypothetical protein